MGAHASAGKVQGTKDYERLEAGVYPARCIQVVELGVSTKHYPAAHGKPAQDKEVKEVLLVWETNEQMEDGRPFIVSWRGSNSLYDKANLYKMLKSWRGKDFTADELKKFALGNILDKCCLLNVSKTESNGKIYNNIVTVMPLAKGMTCNDRVNELVDFGINDLGTPEFDKVYPYVQKWILDSHEGKAFTIGGSTTSSQEEPSTLVDDGDLPF
jgi:hypothetical protein